MRRLPELRDRTLTAAFRRVLASTPDKTAHVGTERSYTFAEAHERALRLGAGLAELSVENDDPVALMLDNHLDTVHVALGIGLTGHIQVPVNTGYRGSFLAHVLNNSAARVLVIEARYLDRLGVIADDLVHLRTVVVRGTAGDVTAAPDGCRVVAFEDVELHDPGAVVDVGPADLMAYMYTSGTTGLSKGIEISHAHAYTYASREDQSRPTSEDRILVTLPLFHLAGQWYGVYQALIAGATCVVEPGFSVSRFWTLVREHAVTQTVMLGAMAELLHQAPASTDDADNPLTMAVMAPLASAPERFAKRFDVEIEPVYGMSEIGAVLGSYGTTLVPGEAGVPRAEYELRLVTEDGTLAPEGEMGELWVRPQYPEIVMRAYHGLPDKTAETLVDGWVHTGDAFRQVDGHFFFADRMRDALRRRGENVSSFEVERVINEYPQVAESAVVGVPSELSEDEIKAVIVVRSGEQIDPGDLTRFLVEHLPYFMVPRFFDFVDELPRTPTQKIQKHVLRASGTSSSWDREAAGIKVTRSGA